MTNNHRSQKSEDNFPVAKRTKVLAAVAQGIVTSDDDDNINDAVAVCDIIENHTTQHKQTTTSNALHALGETIRNTLLEINEIREQNRERRHKELLEILTKMVNEEKIKTDLRESALANPNCTKQEVLIAKQQNSNTNDDSDGKFYNANQLESRNFTLSACNSDSNHPQFNMIINNLVPSDSSSATENLPEKSLTKKNQLPSKTTNKTSLTTLIDLPKDKTKSVLAVKQDTKEEFQKMRAQMIELQRKKMADRERKKREMQMQSN